MTLQFLQRVGEQVGGWLYLIAGFLVFAEAAIVISLVLPGETSLLVAGFAAHQGWIGLWPMIIVAVGAAVLGDSVGYEVGRRLGPRWRASRLGRRAGAVRWASSDVFLARHGGVAVVLGRFTAVLRAVIPGLAGMTGMPYLRTFMPWNVTGGVLWGAGCVLLGYGFSATFASVGRYRTLGPLLLTGLLLVGFVLVRMRGWHRARCRCGRT
jgi:membrane protein DedA with SNARE-associated domain